jgi:endonuclease G
MKTIQTILILAVSVLLSSSAIAVTPLQPRQIANAANERISEKAAYETHTMLNACPQLQWQNNGIWKKLEGLCLDWADKYGSVWVTCGPVLFGRDSSMWLGQDGEKRAAIPDAFFKIVVRLDGDSVETLAFLIPNILPKSKTDLDECLTSIDRIENLIGIDFSTVLDDNVETAVEAKIASAVDWQPSYWAQRTILLTQNKKIGGVI